MGPLSSWVGADPESPGLGITIPRPTGHRLRKAVSPKHQARVQHISVLGERAVGGWEGGDEEALGQGRSAQGESVVEPGDGRGAGMEEGTSQVGAGEGAHGSERTVTCTEIGSTNSSEDKAEQQGSPRTEIAARLARASMKEDPPVLRAARCAR